MVSYKKKGGTRRPVSQGSVESGANTKFKAPTAGYDDVYFYSGSTQGAAEFNNTHQ